MNNKQKLIEALDLIKTMGIIIRTLDENNAHSEYWNNDGDYVPAAVELLPNEDISIGEKLYWADPDNNECSGLYFVIEIKEECIILKNSQGSLVEATINELYKPL